MLAFAGNSILCRMALRDGAIDPASFTSIRLFSGAAALLLIVRLTSKDASIREHGVILFGFVQGTMIAMALWSGDRPSIAEWLGWLLAFSGLIWLLLPGIEAPPAVGATLMALAGIAWGVYSIRGRDETNPLVSTHQQSRRPAGSHLRRDNFRGWIRYLVCRTELPARHAGGTGATIGACDCRGGRRDLAGRTDLFALVDCRRVDTGRYQPRTRAKVPSRRRFVN
jgi:drug/metabolite transporter (DMT)-like permease